MLAALRDDFDTIISIDLHPVLAAKAKQRFQNEPKITVVQGDSATKLPDVIATLDRPALFWLDGHFSGGVTARGNVDTPVIAELTNILSGPPLNHAILIDDARLFGSAPNYPTIPTVSELLQRHRPGWKMSVEMDILRIEPNLA